MFRFNAIILSVLGLLLCPFVCLGNGSLCGSGDRSDCRCNTMVEDPDTCCHGSENGTPSSDETPCQGDCRHECVASQGKVESDSKSAREIIQVWVNIDLGSCLESALVVETLRTTRPREIDHASVSSAGAEMRLVLASLLL